MIRYRVIVGADDAGISYRDAIAADLRNDIRVEWVRDIGVRSGDAGSAPYPSVAIAAAQDVAAGRADRAVLICGTGIGMAVAANKVRGVRATVAHDSYSVERSVLSNDCQVLAVGQRVIGLELARRLVSEWLGYSFDADSASASKVAMITEYEHGTH